MSSSLYEIVELSDGRIGLRRAGEDDEPLVTIAFSEEAAGYITDIKMDIVKVMIEAGLEAAGDLMGSQSSDDESPENRVLH